MEKEVIKIEQLEQAIQQYIEKHPEIKTEYCNVHQDNVDRLNLAMEFGYRPTDFFDYEFTDQAGNHYSLMISDKLSDFGIEDEDSHLAFCETVALEIYQNYRPYSENEDLPYDKMMLAIYDLDFNEVVEVIQYAERDCIRYLKNQYHQHHLKECIDDINMCALRYVDYQEIETSRVSFPTEIGMQMLEDFFQHCMAGTFDDSWHLWLQPGMEDQITIENLYQMIETVIASQYDINTVSGYFLSSIGTNYLQLLFSQYLMFSQECNLYPVTLSSDAIKTPEYERYNQNNQWLRSYEETVAMGCRSFCYELPAFRELVSSVVAEHLFQKPCNGKSEWISLLNGSTNDDLNKVMQDLGVNLTIQGQSVVYDIHQLEQLICSYYQKYQNSPRKAYRLF